MPPVPSLRFARCWGTGSIRAAASGHAMRAVPSLASATARPRWAQAPSEMCAFGALHSLHARARAVKRPLTRSSPAARPRSLGRLTAPKGRAALRSAPPVPARARFTRFRRPAQHCAPSSPSAPLGARAAPCGLRASPLIGCAVGSAYAGHSAHRWVARSSPLGAATARAITAKLAQCRLAPPFAGLNTCVSAAQKGARRASA